MNGRSQSTPAPATSQVGRCMGKSFMHMGHDHNSNSTVQYSTVTPQEQLMSIAFTPYETHAVGTDSAYGRPPYVPLSAGLSSIEVTTSTILHRQRCVLRALRQNRSWANTKQACVKLRRDAPPTRLHVMKWYQIHRCDRSQLLGRDLYPHGK